MKPLSRSDLLVCSIANPFYRAGPDGARHYCQIGPCKAMLGHVPLSI
jgi:hypothetical protein